MAESQQPLLGFRPRHANYNTPQEALLSYGAVAASEASSKPRRGNAFLPRMLFHVGVIVALGVAGVLSISAVQGSPMAAKFRDPRKSFDALSGPEEETKKYHPRHAKRCDYRSEY